MVDRRAPARRARRDGPRAAAKNSRLAPGFETEIDLHRRAAGIHQSDNKTRAHQLRAGCNNDRAAVVVGAEFAEYSGAHRGWAKNPPRLYRIAGHEARVRRLF